MPKEIELCFGRRVKIKPGYSTRQDNIVIDPGSDEERTYHVAGIVQKPEGEQLTLTGTIPDRATINAFEVWDLERVKAAYRRSGLDLDQVMQESSQLLSRWITIR